MAEYAFKTKKETFIFFDEKSEKHIAISFLLVLKEVPIWL
jgi:hypothetical protein